MAKIIGLMANNIKNLKAVEITPTGNMVELRGQNGAGKSAIIDSIFSALTGKRLKDPIQHGQDRADVEVNMGDFIVKKKWTDKGESIQVYSIGENGKKITHNSPQTFLNEKIGALSFDPLAFQGMKPQERVELLKELVGLTFDDINKQRQDVYDQRTGINIKIKDCVAQLQNIEAPDPDCPDAEISYKTELDKIQTLRDKARDYNVAVEATEDLGLNKKERLNGILEYKSQIEALETMITQSQEVIAAIDQALADTKIPEKITEEQIIAAETALQDIENKNVTIKAAKRYRELIRESARQKKTADEHTQRLSRLDQDKATRIANATFPIAGLKFTDDEVLYNETNFDRLSTGEQIRVSTAIGMSLNPDLKVIFIREGALLDKKNLQYIAEQANAKDYQVWVEVCADEASVGFWIENGQVTKVAK